MRSSDGSSKIRKRQGRRAEVPEAINPGFRDLLCISFSIGGYLTLKCATMLFRSSACADISSLMLMLHGDFIPVSVYAV